MSESVSLGLGSYQAAPARIINIPADHRNFVASKDFPKPRDVILAPYFRSMFLETVRGPAKASKVLVCPVPEDLSVKEFVKEVGEGRFIELKEFGHILADCRMELTEAGLNHFFIKDSGGGSRLRVCVKRLSRDWKVYTMPMLQDRDEAEAMLLRGDLVFIRYREPDPA